MLNIYKIQHGNFEQIHQNGYIFTQLYLKNGAYNKLVAIRSRNLQKNEK
jgi:hypothetical protein